METLTFEEWSRIDALLKNGDIFGALKLYRQLAGEGLADAKFAITDRCRLYHPELWERLWRVADDE